MKGNVCFSTKVVIVVLIFITLPLFAINAQNTTNINAAMERSHSAMLAGDFNRAINEATEAIRLTNQLLMNSTSAQRTTLNQMLALAYQMRGLIYYIIDDYAKGIEDYTQAINLGNTDKDSYYNRGRMYSELEDWDHAIADYTQTLRLNTNNKDAYFYRGNAYYFKNDLNRAIADWESLLKIDPNNSKARGNIEIARSQLR